MNIVVTTPTGHVGSHVVRALVQAGERPTVLVRDPSRLDPSVLERVRAVACDQGDTAAVIASTTGADALYWVNPDGTDPDPIAGYTRLGEVVAAAVTANRIPRVVFQSSVGAEVRHGVGEIDGLGRTEELLDATDASVLHLRCGYFFSNLLMDRDTLRAGFLRTAMNLHTPLSWVDPRDIAEVAAGRLLSTSWTGRVVQAVHGPEDLSFVRAAEILSEATGRAIRAEHVAPEVLREQLVGIGITAAGADAIVGMSTATFTPEQPRSLLSTTPSTLAGWAHAVLRPLLS